MPGKIGFILLTHSEPAQILRLVDRLNAMFHWPPIVCHHNFSLCSLSIETFSANVSFVRPHIQTKWADFSVIEATVRAIRQMYEVTEGPD